MIYLSHFELPTDEEEMSWRFDIKRKVYETFYPFFITSKHHLEMLDFEPVTILYGSNGSGKSTVLNVIAEKLGLQRDTLYNRSNFFEEYTDMCHYKTEKRIPRCSRIVTSDDVFDFMLNLRGINEGVDLRREDLIEEYNSLKHGQFQMHSLADYDKLRQVNEARSRTQSRYVRENLNGNIREHSNGESAMMYFEERIQDGGLYLLDEPENSLSPERQMELVKFLRSSADSFDCQFIIATHSPFILAMRGAKIYDLDEEYVDVKRWTELSNVKVWHDFFKEHEDEFR